MFCRTATAVGFTVRAGIYHSTLLAKSRAHCGTYTLICGSSALEALAGRAHPFDPTYLHNVAFDRRPNGDSSLINVFHSRDLQEKSRKDSTKSPWRKVHRAPSMTMRRDEDVDPRIHAVRAASLVLARLPGSCEGLC